MTTHPNHHQRGQLLEDALKWYHNQLEANRRALMWHNGVKSVIRKGAVIQLPSQPDFSGILTGFDGKYVSFDAKLIRAPYYHHDLKRLHQLKTLYEVEQAGGIAFLLVSVEMEQFYLLWPQASWRDERPYSLRVDRLHESPGKGIEIERGGSHRLPAWLDAIERIYECDGVLPDARNQGSK